MKIRKIGLLVAASAACFATSGATPRQHHDDSTITDKINDLGGLVGEWKGPQQFYTDNNTPSIMGETRSHVDYVAGHRFLEEKITTTLPGHEPAEVLHIITWDPRKEVYRAWWFDDTSVNPHVLEGKLEKGEFKLETPPGEGGPTLRAIYTKHTGSDYTYSVSTIIGNKWRTLFNSQLTHP